MVPRPDGSGGIGPKFYLGQMPGPYRCPGRHPDSRQLQVIIGDCRYLYVTAPGDGKTDANAQRPLYEAMV